MAWELANPFELCSKPRTLVRDNGTGLNLNTILTFADHRKIDWHCIARRSPTRNALIERFEGSMHDEFSKVTPFP